MKHIFILLFCFMTLALCDPNDKWVHFEKAVEAMEQNEMLQEAWKEDHIDKFEKGRSQAIPENMLNCPSLSHSSSTPTSVHALRPTDVKVVGAIGDSLTAANGALAVTPLGLLTEYRGRAFAMGGDKDAHSVVTMPNILRFHNDDLEGHSTGRGKKGSKGARLNYAVPGSTAEDLHAQALELVDHLRRDASVDFENDWKVITVFIGGNDACNYFDGQPEQNTPEKFIEGIKKAIDVFHASVPRAFVNLVEVLDLSILPDLSQGIICPLLHRFLCKHIASGKDNDKVKSLISDYNTKIADLVGSGKYDTREDFTVVVQPFFRETTYPKQSNGEPDWSFFAPDCFHFSAKGHAAAGEALWNNMLEPVGEKQTSWHPEIEHVKCPTEQRPFIWTYKNSPGGFAAFAALPQHSSPPSSSSLTYLIAGCSAFAGIIAIAVVIVTIRKRRPHVLGESLENLPAAIVTETNKNDANLNISLTINNELYEEQTNEQPIYV